MTRKTIRGARAPSGPSSVAHPAVRASLAAAPSRPEEPGAEAEPAQRPVPDEGADQRKDAARWQAMVP